VRTPNPAEWRYHGGFLAKTRLDTKTRNDAQCIGGSAVAASSAGYRFCGCTKRSGIKP
jgi:hypothetical protein